MPLGQQLRTVSLGQAGGALAVCPTAAAVVAVGLNDGTVKVVDVEKGTVLQSLSGHGPGVYVDSVDFSEDGRRLMSGSNHTAILVHEVATGAVLVKIKGSAVNSLWRTCWDRRGVIFAACQTEGLRALSAADGSVVCSISGGSSSFQCAVVPRSAPWERLGPLRAVCVTQLATKKDVSLERLPGHVRDEVVRARTQR
eukprot:TRINITY_DN3487_c0_g1_i11.p2 TRINITY_DN3487_c0_g1~~TRINITY_DN3487_c0_g1_i11.p2  ORF type:complete len:197 (+),score=39.56 TRINITY_DN3487_c0_g1_i11:864-1454(+)